MDEVLENKDKKEKNIESIMKKGLNYLSEL